MLKKQLSKYKKVKIERIFTYDSVVAKFSLNYENMFKTVFKQNKTLLEFAPMKGFSEATFLNNAGAPCAVFGPGDFGFAHGFAKKEKIKISEIMKYVDILVSLCHSN